MYVTVDEFRATTNIDLSQFTDEQIEDALLFAQDQFDSLTRRNKYGMWCEPVRKTVRIDGKDQDTLKLPYQIVRLIEVKDGDTVVPCVAYRRFITRTDGQKFTPGAQNVAVTADFGDPTVMVEEDGTLRPKRDIRWAIVLIAEHRLTREKIFKDERVVRIGPLGEIKLGSLTGNVDLDALIESYTVKPQVSLEVA